MMSYVFLPLNPIGTKVSATKLKATETYSGDLIVEKTALMPFPVAFTL